MGAKKSEIIHLYMHSKPEAVVMIPNRMPIAYQLLGDIICKAVFAPIDC